MTEPYRETVPAPLPENVTECAARIKVASHYHSVHSEQHSEQQVANDKIIADARKPMVERLKAQSVVNHEQARNDAILAKAREPMVERLAQRSAALHAGNGQSR